MTGPELEKHAAATVVGGGCAKGAMTEPEREKHAAAIVAGGRCVKGAMTGPDREKHAAAIVAGAGCAKGARSKKGPMTEPEQEQHCALLAQGYLDKHRTMMQLANGKAGQQNLWECSISKEGTTVLYHFSTDNQPKIDCVRNFEKYLLDVQNGYVQGKLTKEGVLARMAMENNRDRSDSVNAARKRKRQLQGK